MPNTLAPIIPRDRQALQAPGLFLSWRSGLEALASRGKTRKTSIRHQGDLHQARAEHLGQYFTPLSVSRFMWQLVAPAINRAHERENRRCAVIDTSCGSGRLLHFVSKEKCYVDGVDIDGRLIEGLSSAAAAAGLPSSFESACMSGLSISGYAAALINPPFSLQLASPVMEPLPCTTHGKYGLNTHALSHQYALEQALGGAAIVCALLPSTQAQNLPPATLRRLVARFALPSSTFQEERANVQTAICLFGPERRAGAVPVDQTLTEIPSIAPDFGLNCPTMSTVRPRLIVKGVDASCPSIHLPVTGSPRVRVFRAGRKIRLGFECGLTQARVENAVLRDVICPAPGQRLPKGWRYLGDGALDIQVHLAQPCPATSFNELLSVILKAGGKPDVDPGLPGYLSSQTRKLKVIKEPPERWVVSGSLAKAATITATAREAFMVDPDDWGSPSVRLGEEVVLSFQGNEQYTAQIGGQTLTLPAHEVERLFVLPAQTRGWTQIYQGRAKAFPARADQIMARMSAEGIDQWLTWPHQISSVIENKMTRRGLAAWRMSLGKARGAIAFCLLGGRHNLIVVEPYLVDEMISEFRKVVLAGWKLLRRPSDLDDLARVNLVTYNSLRANRAVMAKRLRRRCHTVVLDEADILSNPGSQRSRATARLAGRESFLLTGTPVNNVPRNLLPLIAHAWGDATASQPYGIHGPYLDPALRKSARHVQRGLDAFRDDFITLVWTSNQFNEDNRAGAKREIPVIANPPKFRNWIAPLMSRWTGFEPPLEGHIRIPTPQYRHHKIKWDDKHLAHYLRVADDFREWYLKARGDGRANNLVAVLARIGAVEMAANCPEKSRLDPYCATTTKQRAVVERAAELAGAGQKTIVVARYPDMLDRMARLLRDQHGIDSVSVHGGRSIAERNRQLQDDFRNGTVNVAFISYGCGERGLNLPEASHILLASRCWKATTENQVIARLCRAQQKNQVWAEYFELAGSIDAYQDQMVAFKREAELVGVDFGDASLAAEEFDHIDTILGRFVRDIVDLRGCNSARELRDLLEAA